MRSIKEIPTRELERELELRKVQKSKLDWDRIVKQDMERFKELLVEEGYDLMSPLVSDLISSRKLLFRLNYDLIETQRELNKIKGASIYTF